jgi:hypothetical protein
MLRKSKSLLLKVMVPDGNNELYKGQMVLGLSTEVVHGNGYVYLAPKEIGGKDPKYRAERFVPVLPPHIEDRLSTQIIRALERFREDPDWSKNLKPYE